MQAAGSIVFVILIIGGVVAYNSWLMNGIKPRTVRTSATDQQLAQAFNEAVVGRTWKLMDDGNPMVAQSSLVTGIRQQIAMQTEPGSGTRIVRIQPIRVVKTWLGVPRKAHTLRMRLDGFTKRVQAVDPNATITKG